MLPECLNPIRKETSKKMFFCLFKFFQHMLPRMLLQPKRLKQWPAFILAPQLLVKTEQNTQPYFWKAKFIAFPGTSKHPRKADHLLHGFMPWSQGMGTDSCYSNTKIYQFFSSPSTSPDSTRIWLYSRVPRELILTIDASSMVVLLEGPILPSSITLNWLFIYHFVDRFYFFHGCYYVLFLSLFGVKFWSFILTWEIIYWE